MRKKSRRLREKERAGGARASLAHQVHHEEPTAEDFGAHSWEWEGDFVHDTRPEIPMAASTGVSVSS